MANELFNDTFIGTVLKVDKTTREVAVYIPRLMPTLYDGDPTDYKVPTNSGIHIETTNTNIASTVIKSNYIWTRPRDMKDPIPAPGSKVFITFLDDRPSMPLWWRCNINNDYDVIPEEKYERQHSLTLNNSRVTVFRDDDINIELPSYFRVTAEESDERKSPLFSIYENYNFYKQTGLEESITNLQKSMEFIELEYKKTFVTNLNNIEFTPVTTNSISFPTPITTYQGGIRVPEAKINSFKLYLITELNDLYNNVSTIYPQVYRQEIIDKIKTTKYAIEQINSDKDLEYWQIVRQFYTWLSDYNFDLGGFLSNSFSKILEKSKTQIKSTSNLLDCSEIYTQYNKLLQGLVSIYNLYSTYNTKYNNISDTNILNNLSQQGITQDRINDNIIIAFERAYDSVDLTDVDSYLKYLKTLFPTQVTVTYVYSNNGLNNNILYTENTNKLFEVYGNTIYQPLTDNKDENDNYIPDEIIPTTITEPEATIAYDSELYDWVTEDDNISITNNYYLTHNIRVVPQYLFSAVVYDDNVYKLITWDNIPGEEKEYTYTLTNGEDETEYDDNDIEELNTEINTLCSTTNTNFSIAVVCDNNIKTTTATVTVNNSADISKTIIDNLENAIEYINSIITDGKLEPDYQQLYDTYTEYNNMIVAREMNPSEIEYTDDNNTVHTYNNCVTEIKTIYGTHISNLIRSTISDLDKLDSESDEYSDLLSNIQDMYDHYEDDCILNLTSEELEKIDRN